MLYVHHLSSCTHNVTLYVHHLSDCTYVTLYVHHLSGCTYNVTLYVHHLSGCTYNVKLYVHHLSSCTYNESQFLNDPHLMQKIFDLPDQIISVRMTMLTTKIITFAPCRKLLLNNYCLNFTFHLLLYSINSSFMDCDITDLRI